VVKLVIVNRRPNLTGVAKHTTPLGFLFFSKFLVYKHFTPIGVACKGQDQLLGIAPKPHDYLSSREAMPHASVETRRAPFAGQTRGPMSLTLREFPNRPNCGSLF